MSCGGALFAEPLCTCATALAYRPRQLLKTVRLFINNHPAVVNARASEAAGGGSLLHFVILNSNHPGLLELLLSLFARELVGVHRVLEAISQRPLLSAHAVPEGDGLCGLCRQVMWPNRMCLQNPLSSMTSKSQ